MQIYVGVLVKYVNFGKGWRHRLFVLKGGVLRYYKVASALNPDRPFSLPYLVPQCPLDTYPWNTATILLLYMASNQLQMEPIWWPLR